MNLFSLIPDLYIVGGTNGALQAVDLKVGKSVHTFDTGKGNTSFFSFLAVTPDCSELYCATSDGNVVLYDMFNCMMKKKVKVFSNAVWGLHYLKNRIVGSSQAGEIKTMQLGTLQTISEEKIGGSDSLTVYGEDTVFVGTNQQSVQVRDVNTLRLRTTYAGLEDNPFFMAVHKNFLICGGTQAVTIIDIDTGSIKGKVKTTGNSTCVSVFVEGDHLYAGTNGTITVYEFPSLVLKRSFQAHSGYIYNISPHPVIPNHIISCGHTSVSVFSQKDDKKLTNIELASGSSAYSGILLIPIQSRREKNQKDKLLAATRREAYTDVSLRFYK